MTKVQLRSVLLTCSASIRLKFTRNFLEIFGLWWHLVKNVHFISHTFLFFFLFLFRAWLLKKIFFSPVFVPVKETTVALKVKIVTCGNWFSHHAEESAAFLKLKKKLQKNPKSIKILWESEMCKAPIGQRRNYYGVGRESFEPLAHALLVPFYFCRHFCIHRQNIDHVSFVFFRGVDVMCTQKCI